MYMLFILVIISQYFDQQRGDMVQFFIRDTGIGISKQKVSSLFKHLGQLNASHERKYYGAGLGLFYVQSIANLLDGKIEVNSVLEKGSEFTLSVPTNIEQMSDNSELF